MRVLFVCTGNICRSPMAEGLARHIAGCIGITSEAEFRFLSAGVSAVEGGSPTREAVTVMRLRGVDITGHRARVLTGEMVRSTDLVLAMEREHALVSRSLGAGARPAVHLLMKLGEAAVSGGSSRAAGGPEARLAELEGVYTAMEQDGSFSLPDYLYEVLDPVGLDLERYDAVAGEMERSIEAILRFLLKGR